jgi:hypothetical protein
MRLAKHNRSFCVDMLVLYLLISIKQKYDATQQGKAPTKVITITIIHAKSIIPDLFGVVRVK